MLKKIAYCIVLLCSIFSASSFAGPPAFKKVMIIILENTDYDVALKQPFLGKLAQQGAYFSHFNAETHPSQPNYIALISGDTMGVRNDSNRDLDGNHIGNLLEQAGKTWKVYAEDYPGNCFLKSHRGLYARKHVPFISFKNVQNDPQRCSRVVNSSEFDRDIAQGTMPDFSLFIPNLKNDGHNTGAAYADQYLTRYFGPKLQDPAFMKDLLLVVTFDEAEGSDLFKNQIYTVFYGPSVTPGTVVEAKSNHYTILRTIEDAFGLGTLGRHDADASATVGIWKP